MTEFEYEVEKQQFLAPQLRHHHIAVALCGRNASETKSPSIFQIVAIHIKAPKKAGGFSIHSYDLNIKAIGNTVDNVERKKKKSGGSRPIDKPLNTTSSSKNSSRDKREVKNLELTSEELIYFSSEREKSERFIDQESNISIDKTLDAEFINAWAFTEKPNNQEKSRIAESTYCRLNSSYMPTLD
ncbi:hypothetical protein HELRODRAFT_172607 [Helobdella robusta]|uniref:Uncharacterized protein n=1 Tax=Helobdella robusta TaxID=6412 RepID=T1F5M0_HELRO|nr:hypothetical protein HELRODRAFT_172607 [Helobdella robusta]ESO04251.1 hypothetical protein HELRODRAFT_172607 [Helobdella robusta]